MIKRVNGLDEDYPVVAVFDFDGTLTKFDSLFPFLMYVAGPIRFFIHLSRSLPDLLRFFWGRMGNQEAKERILARFLKGTKKEKLMAMGGEFSRKWIKNFLRPMTMQRLQWHQLQGHQCVLISASLDIYLAPWARDHHIDAALCTSLQFDNNGVFTGRLHGENCYGEEKVRRLRAWIEKPALLFVYGDSAGDNELLEIADFPYYKMKNIRERQ